VVRDTIIYFNTYNKATGTGHNGDNHTKHTVIANPNPTMGWTTFNWDLKGYSRLLILSGYTGKMVRKYEVDPRSVSYQADLSRLGNGPYYIRLEGRKLTPLNGQFMKAKE